jgi:hypothetical protein
MIEFTFKTFDTETGDSVVIETATDTWSDTFEKYLNLMRASGFILDQDIRLFVPNGQYVAEDNDMIMTSDDLTQCKSACHSKYFYDTDRNK